MKSFLFLPFFFVLSLLCNAQNHEVYTIDDCMLYDNSFKTMRYEPAIEAVFYQWTPLTSNFTFENMTARSITISAPKNTVVRFKYYARYYNGDELTLIVTGITQKENSNGGGHTDLPSEPNIPEE